MASPLVWFGGKQRFAEKIVSYFPEKFNNYFEPFAGSASIYFYLKQKGKLKGKKAMLSDRNVELISVYHALQDDLRRYETLRLLREHISRHDKKYFNSLKKEVYSSIEEFAARFLYFNRCCYSGIYRENRYGGFHIGMKPSNISWLHESAFMIAGEQLKGATIKSIDYSLILQYVNEGDLIYLDPPYQSFYESSSRRVYSMFDFTTEHQRELKNFCDECSNKGAFIVQSNSPSDVIYELYEDNYSFDTFECIYKSDSVFQYATNELLIMNYPIL